MSAENCKCGFRAPELGPHPACPEHSASGAVADKRRIRVHCEVNFSGCDIEDSYYDLPAGWDDYSEKQRADFLYELSENELSNHATSGAWVVDENGKEVDE